MNLLPRLLGKFLLVDIHLDKECTTVVPVEFKWKGGNIDRIDTGAPVVLKEKKNCPAVISVSGTGVVTRSYDRNGPDLVKLTGNDKLVVQRDYEDRERVTVSFFRRDALDDTVREMEKNGIMLLDIILCGRPAGVQDGGAKERLHQILSFRHLGASKPRLNAFFELMFRKMKLPALVFFFLLLLVNFFLNDHLRGSLERKNAAYNSLVHEARLKNDNEAAIARLTSDYYSSGKYIPLAFLCDRLASHVPDGIYLEEMSANPVTGKIVPGKKFNMVRGIIIVKGVTDMPGTVVALCRNILEDGTFGTVKVVSLSGRKDTGKLDFELAILTE